MMLRNGNFLLIYQAEDLNQLYIIGMVLDLFLLGIQYKCKTITTGWIICWQGHYSWSEEILMLLD